jgi:hypothetical protein
MIHLKFNIGGDITDLKRLNPDLVEVARRATEIMFNKNTERNDCWKATGIMGAFVEIHSIYNRLREMIWNRPMDPTDEKWMRELLNCTMDMRNFTILMELAAKANLPMGDDSYERRLICKNCNQDTVEEVK